MAFPSKLISDGVCDGIPDDAPVWRFTMDNHREFECLDCHCIVLVWMGNLLCQRCAVCTWIHDQPNLTKEQIAEIRVLTATPILEKNDD
jgi:hypothetical protein